MMQSGTLTAGLTSSQVVNFDVTLPVAFSGHPGHCGLELH